MGRYYYGDIEGKFWFGIQPSFAADRFGCTVYETDEDDYDEECTYQTYWYQFDSSHLPDIQEELDNIANRIGYDNLNTLHRRYSQDNVITELADDAARHLADYADYILGVKILDCVTSTGSCYFEVDP